MQRHRHQEFLRFLNTVEAAVPAGKLVHCILDNYGTHKHPKVLAWLARHPRWTFPFTPTSGSWLNAVESFFSALTRRRLRRGVFGSIVELPSLLPPRPGRQAGRAARGRDPARRAGDPDATLGGHTHARRGALARGGAAGGAREGRRCRPFRPVSSGRPTS